MLSGVRVVVGGGCRGRGSLVSPGNSRRLLPLQPNKTNTTAARYFTTNNTRTNTLFQRTSNAKRIIKVPAMGDSITEGTIQKWLKQPGDFVQTDELIAQIETDKITVDIRAPEPGKIVEIFAKEDETVLVDANLYKLDTSAAPPKGAEAPKEQPKKEEPKKEKEPEPVKKAEAPKEQPKKVEEPPKPQPAPTVTAAPVTGRGEHRQRMSRMRMRIADRLKGAQNTYAMLTTFNEVDMSAVIAMRNDLKDEFQEKHGIKLGFMSAFVKAAATALKEQPIVNAVIDGDEIVYYDYVDISVAVATPTGLVVPVVRDCDKKSFAQIEKEIFDFGKRAREGTLALEEMAGGTFTISNEGVYGSMMGTPIINPPQSAILGMHAITKRAVVVDDQIVIRPMMYLALTYDHRLIDGKDAVTFLKRIRDLVQDPRRLLLS